MMYNQKLVACIKNNGQILKEYKGICLLPFGAEYSILIKNLNTVRASVRISIDGEDVMNGKSIIVNANDSVELERYLKNLNEGNRFKFIERSESVEQHRGVGAEDGLIRIEYQFEKPYASYRKSYVPDTRNNPLVHNVWYGSTDNPLPKTLFNTTISSNVATKGMTNDSFSVNSNSVSIASYFASNVGLDCSLPCADSLVNDVGITVPGSLSSQRFVEVAELNLESETHVIVLHIKGDAGEKKVVKPVTVKHKPKCQTCGRVNKATAKFCTNCGTSLEVV